MPRVKRKGASIREHLSQQQVTELLLGPAGESKSAFASEKERSIAWRAFGVDLMADWPDGTRLWGFERYGDPERKPV